MQNKMDKLKQKTNNNKKIIMFLLGIFIIGIIFGSAFVVILSKNDQELVKEYIKTFIYKIDNDKLKYLNAFKNNLLSNSIFISIIWLLGISIIGIPIIIFMYFSKAFILGFSISSFILQYKTKGLLLAFIYFFPHHVINVIIYTLLMIYSIKISIALINGILKKKAINFKIIMNKYLIILGISLILIVITSLYECFVVPLIIKRIIQFVV